MSQFKSVLAVSSLALCSGATAQTAVQWRAEDGGNGHWSAAVENGSLITWSASRDAAIARGGHLATISSAEENATVSTLVTALGGNVFLGGYQPDPSSPTSEGWFWIDGSPWSYTNWNSGEPNDQGSPNESFLEMWGDTWNDTPEQGSQYNTHRYSIEWSADCNADGIVDYGQILDGSVVDANSDGIPDCCIDGTDCGPNLLVNGSFEGSLPAPCNGFLTLSGGSTAIPGWRVVNGPNIDWQWENVVAGSTCCDSVPHGHRNINLNGSPAQNGGAIDQTINTVAGVRYRLTLRAVANECCTAVGTANPLRITTGATVSEHTLLTLAGNPQCDFASWSSIAHEWIADAPTTRVELRSLLSNNAGGPIVDGVVVIEVGPHEVTVPTDYSTIQAAIDAAPVATPWIIHVLAGTYHESFRMNGKHVVVRGAADNATILDGTDLTVSIAQCIDGEPATAGLENLVFRNGIVGSRFAPESTFTIGGAIFVMNSAAHIRDCRFESCRADFGGAIYQYVGGVSWENCVFTNNIANVDGGGALIYNTTGIVQGCTFTGNQVGMEGPGSGSALKVVGSNGDHESVVLQSCTITGNFAWDSGSAVEVYEHSKYHPVVLHIVDTLITKNSSGDPLLAGAAGLRVLGGQSSCVVSGSTSLCGNAPFDVDGPFLLEDPATVCGCFADITGDGFINGGDLGIVLSSWGAALPSGIGDVNHDGFVTSIDLALVLSEWGTCP